MPSPTFPTAERNRRVFEMHHGGATYPEIAAAFGISRQRAYQIVEQERHRRAKRKAADLDLASQAAGIKARLALLIRARDALGDPGVKVHEARAKVLTIIALDLAIDEGRAELAVIAEEQESRSIDRLLGLVPEWGD
ncbi:MAG TPA: helix-turn-helix domain-containing protein [Candidatus Limnocylindrales bacterium]|nr:helix-turn-helix domain-containing protein [Candidatus Limnocylindrales bacterium]